MVIYLFNVNKHEFTLNLREKIVQIRYTVIKYVYCFSELEYSFHLIRHSDNMDTGHWIHISVLHAKLTESTHQTQSVNQPCGAIYSLNENDSISKNKNKKKKDPPTLTSGTGGAANQQDITGGYL